MIQLSKNYSLPEREEEIVPIKVVGVGGAGSNAVDRVLLDGLERADLIAINTDVQSLASSVARAQSAAWSLGYARSRRGRRSGTWLSVGGGIGRRDPAGAGWCANDFCLRGPGRWNWFGRGAVCGAAGAGSRLTRLCFCDPAIL